ncbi:MAG: SDR family NAD(P)-dependent oxidoreductase, partial [Clostridia bacterium]|nr:SDR family NAD(P)-dependent oxidoreductase [Clostridia bacterium]
MNFKGKVALITGAAVGIGRAAALKFAEGGADLLLIDLSEEKLAVVKEEVAPFNVKVESYVDV